MGRRGDHVVIVELSGVDGLHGQQQRHDLGDAGGLQLGMFVLGEEDGARLLSISRAEGADTSSAWALLPSASRAHSSTTSFFMVIPLCFDGRIYVREKAFMPEKIWGLQNMKRSGIITTQMRL